MKNYGFAHLRKVLNPQRGLCRQIAYPQLATYAEGQLKEHILLVPKFVDLQFAELTCGSPIFCYQTRQSNSCIRRKNINRTPPS